MRYGLRVGLVIYRSCTYSDRIGGAAASALAAHAHNDQVNPAPRLRREESKSERSAHFQPSCSHILPPAPDNILHRNKEFHLREEQLHFKVDPF